MPYGALAMLLLIETLATSVLIHKGFHICHQAVTTRACTLLNQNECKIHLHAMKYKDVHTALLRTHSYNVSSFEQEEPKQKYLMHERSRCT